MNIWLLTIEYPPDYGGGIATYTYHTARMMVERGHSVTVFAGSNTQPHGGREEENTGGLRVVRFGLNQTPQSIALGEFARWSYDASAVLADYFRNETTPDVLEAHDYLGLPYFTLQRRWLMEAGFKQLPVLVTSHTPLYICDRYNGVPEYRFPVWWIGEIERFSLVAADKVVFPSARLLNEVKEELPQVVKKASVIPSPYPKQDIAREISLTGRRGFLFTAKIERLKGIEPLIKAFSRLWNNGIEEPLILLGADWYDEFQQRWMSEILRDHYGQYMEAGLLSWRGKQPPEIVQQTLGEVRGMILPSLFENYPYAVLEAMASGCPVIVSDSGGHAEIVQNGKSGFIFSHKSPGDLEEKVLALLSLNETEWQKMALTAQQRVQELSSYENVAPQKEIAYQEAIEQAQEKHAHHFPYLRKLSRPLKEDNFKVEQQEGLLSIVIPFYNLGEYLEDTLQSLQGLDDIPHEIIIVDDGSDDPSSLIKLEELQGRYSFRLLRKENEGVAIARNAGAFAARGEFLAFLDADDCVEVAYYREAIKVLNRYPEISFIGCWVEYFGEAENYWPTWNPEPPYALVHNPLNTSAMVYRRIDFLRYGLNDPTIKSIEDYDSLLSMLEKGLRGVSLPYPYFKYRVRTNSRFHTAPINKQQKDYEQLAQKHAFLYRQYAEEVFCLLNTNGPCYLYDNPTLWYPPVTYPVIPPPPPPEPAPPPEPGEVPNPMLNLSASEYFYLLIRALLLKPYSWLRNIIPQTDYIKDQLKRILVKE